MPLLKRSISFQSTPALEGVAADSPPIVTQSALHPAPIARSTRGTDLLHVRAVVDLIPKRRLRLRGDLIDRITGIIRHHQQRFGGGRAARHGQFSLRVKSLLARQRTNQNGRKQALSKKLRGQIHLPRIDHQARPERDTVEGGALAAGNLRKRQRVQFSLGDGFELRCVDEFLRRWNAARRFPCQLLSTQQRRCREQRSIRGERLPPGGRDSLHGKSVLTMLRLRDARVGRPV